MVTVALRWGKSKRSFFVAKGLDKKLDMEYFTYLISWQNEDSFLSPLSSKSWGNSQLVLLKIETTASEKKRNVPTRHE